MAIHDRLIFVNEAFGILDKFNGGYLKGSRTTDNIFILKTLLQRQLLTGEQLFVCFVDFSKAFDRVNRHISFYKLFKSGLHGRVIETLHNLYQKTYFRESRESLARVYSTVLGLIKEAAQAMSFSDVTWQILGSIWIKALVSVSKR